MAKVVELTSVRESISDPFPNDGTDRAIAFSGAIDGVLANYNGTIAVHYSDDGLSKTITLMFPDSVDLPAVRADFEAAINLSATDLSEIETLKQQGKYQLTIVNE